MKTDEPEPHAGTGIWRAWGMKEQDMGGVFLCITQQLSCFVAEKGWKGMRVFRGCEVLLRVSHGPWELEVLPVGPQPIQEPTL